MVSLVFALFCHHTREFLNLGLNRFAVTSYVLKNAPKVLLLRGRRKRRIVATGKQFGLERDRNRLNVNHVGKVLPFAPPDEPLGPGKLSEESVVGLPIKLTVDTADEVGRESVVVHADPAQLGPPLLKEARLAFDRPKGLEEDKLLLPLARPADYPRDLDPERRP